jgi:hypothetical protein
MGYVPCSAADPAVEGAYPRPLQRQYEAGGHRQQALSLTLNLLLLLRLYAVLLSP